MGCTHACGKCSLSSSRCLEQQQQLKDHFSSSLDLFTTTMHQDRLSALGLIHNHQKFP